MTGPGAGPERTTIGGVTSIPRIISGLWQLADRDAFDVDAAAQVMGPLVEAGFDCFDMADHYGDAGGERTFLFLFRGFYLVTY